MTGSRCVVFGLVLSGSLTAASAVAQAQQPVQDRRFLFSISTVPADTQRVSVHLETQIGEGAFTLRGADTLEQRFGVQAALGHRIAFVGRVGVATNERDLWSSQESSQQGDLLYSLFESRRSEASVAVGGGMRHEATGANVLMTRVAAGRSFSAWRVDGNALVEKPFAIGRDAVDLITTFGVSRALTAALHAGVELIGEDLEGFWERE